MGFKKSYVINRVGQEKILCLLTRWVGGSKKGPKYAYIIFEWSLIATGVDTTVTEKITVPGPFP